MRSTSGEGTIFAFTLPLLQQDEERA
jgi:hypothetical protein